MTEMTEIPKAAIEATTAAIFSMVCSDETSWDYCRNIARDALSAALPHLPGYQEPIVRAVERILDESGAWIARPNKEVTERIALAAGIAILSSMSERHDQVYDTGFVVGQEAMREAAATAAYECPDYMRGMERDDLGRLLPGSPYDRGRYDASNSIRALPIAPALDQHPDDAAVDRFAAAMKSKLAQKRAEGRGGWNDKAQCSQERLSQLLRDHVEKGDPVDVGNFAMMLHQRGEGIAPLVQPWRPIENAPKDGTKILVIDASKPARIFVAEWRYGEWRALFSGVAAMTHYMPLPAPPAEGA